MPRNRTVELYRQFYVDMQFERSGLFQAIRAKYGCRTALYPGCSFHITPSFFFPHVVYVDHSQAAQEFFADREGLLQFIRRNKRYPESAYFRFIRQDFNLALPLQLDDFDLLISIYTGGIAKACKRHLKAGGILLADNHNQDAAQAAADPELEFIGVVSAKRQTYRVTDTGLGDYFVLRNRVRRKPGPNVIAEPEYIRSAEYYLFKRIAH